MKVKWLSDEEISYFKSDFKFVLEYLRMERTGNAEDWGRQKVSHIHDLLNLLKSISRNENVTTMEDFIIKTQGEARDIQMSDLFQTYWDKGHTEGISFATKVMASLYERCRDFSTVAILCYSCRVSAFYKLSIKKILFTSRAK